MSVSEPQPLGSGPPDKPAMRAGKAYPICVLPLAMPIVADSQVLYTNGFLNGSSTVQVDSINLSTGALTPVVTTDAVSLLSSDAAFDPVGHRLFFVGAPANAPLGLYTANVQTGAFSKLPGSFGNLVFDVATSTLYTDGFINGSSTVQVASINLSTGALTPVVTTDAVSLLSVNAAFDPVGHRLFFVGTPANAPLGLYTANVQTGAFSKLPGSFGNLVFDPGGPVNPPATPAPSTLILVVIGLSGVIVARAWNYARRAKQRSGNSA